MAWSNLSGDVDLRGEKRKENVEKVEGESEKSRECEDWGSAKRTRFVRTVVRWACLLLDFHPPEAGAQRHDSTESICRRILGHLTGRFRRELIMSW